MYLWVMFKPKLSVCQIWYMEGMGMGMHGPDLKAGLDIHMLN